MNYDHFAFCEKMARTLRAVGHTDQKQQYYKASGSDWLTDLEDRLSAASGTVLIAVNSGELDTQGFGAEGVQDGWKYYIILAQQTDNDHRDTVHAAHEACQKLAIAVRNVLFRRYPRMPRTCSIFDVGPLADNFYGSALEFTMVTYDNYAPDASLFMTDDD